MQNFSLKHLERKKYAAPRLSYSTAYKEEIATRIHSYDDVLSILRVYQDLKSEVRFFCVKRIFSNEPDAPPKHDLQRGCSHLRRWFFNSPFEICTLAIIDDVIVTVLLFASKKDTYFLNWNKKYSGANVFDQLLNNNSSTQLRTHTKYRDSSNESYQRAMRAPQTKEPVDILTVGAQQPDPRLPYVLLACSSSCWSGLSRLVAWISSQKESGTSKVPDSGICSLLLEL